MTDSMTDVEDIARVAAVGIAEMTTAATIVEMTVERTDIEEAEADLASDMTRGTIEITETIEDIRSASNHEYKSSASFFRDYCIHVIRYQVRKRSPCYSAPSTISHTQCIVLIKLLLIL